jgi:hypothetical protein
VPQKELGVSMNIGCQCLMESDQVLISALGLFELARSGLAHQALDRINECLSVAGAVRVPFCTHTWVGTSSRSRLGVRGSQGVEGLFLRLSGGFRL